MLWNKNEPIASSFCELQDINIENCNKLRRMFPWSIVKSLAFLETLNIFDCELLERIFETEKSSFATEEEESGEIVFNSLTHLEFYNLPRLACFYFGKCTLKFPCLNFLKISRCHDMKTFSYGITNTPNLQAIEIGENEVLVSSTKGINDIIQVFFTQEVSFPQMEYLYIDRCNNLEMLWHNNGPINTSFTKLQTIRIEYCNKLKCVFPSNIVASLVCLEDLYICSCELLERVFEIAKPTFGDTKVLVPLRSLYLSRLPNLMYVWDKDAGDVLEFPNLKNVDVTSCSKLKSIFPASFTKYMKEIERLNVEEENEIFPVDEASNMGEVVRFQSLETLA
ncbi:uncharacterized protein LOC120089073 [Benincasa hispida]|uniref:uncharacterized protein LOC120089073 n=1 Tax=Benincasa hispida TaxID=102211 RepID=UPI00190018E9|nr:uncharacterized protein LOC120089073 [Benincasa hispida]